MKKLTFNAPINSPNQSCRVFKGNTQITDRPYNLVNEPFVYRADDINGTYTIRCTINGEICTYIRIVENESISTTYQIEILKDVADTDIDLYDEILVNENFQFVLKSSRVSGNEIFTHDVNLTITNGEEYGNLDTTSVTFSGNSPEYKTITYTPTSTSSSPVTINISSPNDKVLISDVGFSFSIVNEIVTNTGEYVITLLDSDKNPITGIIEMVENSELDLIVRSTNVRRNNASERFSLSLPVIIGNQLQNQTPQYITIEPNILNYNGYDDEDINITITSGEVATSKRLSLIINNETEDVDVKTPSRFDIEVKNDIIPYADYNVKLLTNGRLEVSTVPESPTKLDNDYQGGNVDMFLVVEKINDGTDYPFNVSFKGISVSRDGSAVSNSIEVNSGDTSIPITIHSLSKNRPLIPIKISTYRGYRGSNYPGDKTYYVSTPGEMKYDFTLSFDSNYNGTYDRVDPRSNPVLYFNLPEGRLPFKFDIIVENGLLVNNTLTVELIENDTRENTLFRKDYTITPSTRDIVDEVPDLPLTPSEDPFSLNTTGTVPSVFDCIFKATLRDDEGKTVKDVRVVIKNNAVDPFSSSRFYITKFENKICNNTANITDNVRMRNMVDFLKEDLGNVDLNHLDIIEPYDRINISTGGAPIIYVGVETPADGNVKYRTYSRNPSLRLYELSDFTLKRCVNKYSYDVVFCGVNIEFTMDGQPKIIYEQADDLYYTPHNPPFQISLAWLEEIKYEDHTIEDMTVTPLFHIFTTNNSDELTHNNIDLHISHTVNDLRSNFISGSTINPSPTIQLENLQDRLDDDNPFIYDEYTIKELEPNRIHIFKIYLVDDVFGENLDYNLNLYISDRRPENKVPFVRLDFTTGLL